MKRVAIYARVSTADKQDYHRQINELTQIAKQHGFKDNQIQVYAESMSGYKKEERVQLQTLLSKATDYATIYVSEISRIGRNPTDTRQIIDTLTNQGVPVYIQSLGLWTIENGKRNFITNIILQVLMEYANLEAETFKVRSKSGLLNAAKQGKAGGSANFPYGYTKDEEGYLVVNEEEVPVVEQIFNLYQEGNGIKVISNILNNQGIPTRTNKTHQGKTIKHKNFEKLGDNVRWSDKQIHDILRNPLYKGKRRFKGELLDAPAIISAELWDECQNIMQGKTHRNYLTTYTYLLKDLCTCGECHRNYFAKYKPVQGGDKVYVCSSKLIKGGSCGNLGINISLLESAIYDLLLSSDNILKFINSGSDVKKKLESELKNLQQQLPIATNQVEDKRKEVDRLLDVYLTGSLSKDKFNSKNKELVSQVEALESRVKLIQTEIANATKGIANMGKVSTTKKMLETAKNDRQVLRSIYQQLIHHVYILANKNECRAEIRFKINGVVSYGVVHLLLDKKGINQPNKTHRYKSVFIQDTEADIFDGDIFEESNWVNIPDEHIIKVTNAKHG